ncbi:monoacylglycerol lipase ABHD12 [Galendromus occidentalis]|uniref:Monoacylglycerol lipase ABHD12 n=1 Tax=Galendromus occidentalis TaxID=34638 RepID=A0AAJ6QM30_9ACAR|nr:monoacylglycerol lipase ABHD12 [Galendromus occidentalis]
MELRQRRSAGTSSTRADLPSTSSGSSKKEKRKNLVKRGCQVVLFKIVAAFLILYLAIPIWFYNSQWVRQHVVFLTFVNIPPFLNLSDPDGFGLHCPRNFYVESDPGIKLGTWYIPSDNEKCDRNGPLFQGEDPVVLYLHGNSGSRGGNHRVELYKLLTTKAKVNVVAFDYRGYGDSVSEEGPSVDGLVHDALAVYKWLRERVPAERVVVWGHSLGTGVATHLLADLNKLKERPAALVLESPFDELANVVKHHPLSRMHRFMPYFQDIFVDSLKNDPTTSFNSFEKSKLVDPKLPVMILHAKDDGVIPFSLADRLHKGFESSRGSSRSTEFVTFESELGYGHKYIYTHPGLHKKVRDFFDGAIASRSETDSQK